jgi:hypothetical protein
MMPLAESDWWVYLVQSPFLFYMIPIVGILAWAVVSLVRMQHRHQERLAMIERGMHPDRGDTEDRCC